MVFYLLMGFRDGNVSINTLISVLHLLRGELANGVSKISENNKWYESHKYAGAPSRVTITDRCASRWQVVTRQPSLKGSID